MHVDFLMQIGMLNAAGTFQLGIKTHILDFDLE